MKFTDKGIRALKPKDSRYFIHADMSNDKHGFAIAVYPVSSKYPNGTKSWFFIYRYEGKRCFLPLGKYPTVTLADAARKFDEHWEILISGKNPATVAEDRQAEREAAPIFKELGADYIKRHAEVNKKSWEEDKRILEKEVYPTWGKRKAADIAKRDVISLLEKVIDRGSPSTANQVFKIIRKLFNWAVEKDRLQISPCLGVKMPSPVNPKDRALSTEEIKTVWAALDGELSMTPEVRRAMKLILVTAQRPGEVTGMHTSEIDGNWWTISVDRSKNKKAHRVYLSPLAHDIITQAIAEAKASRDITADQDYSGYIFPCPHRDKDQPIARHALSKAVLRNASILGVATFTPHDLRRTAATFMAESGEMDEVIDAVLNHAKQGIIRTYNLYRYDKEKQQALESWSRRLLSITTAIDMSNVFSIQTGKAA
jgi:integrase